MRSTNVDSRNVKRGACNDCDCDAYEYVKERGQTCDYCNCPPTKHQKLGVVSQPDTVQPTTEYTVTYQEPVPAQPQIDSLAEMCNVSIHVDDPELLSMISSTSASENPTSAATPTSSSQPYIPFSAPRKRGPSRKELLQSEIDQLRLCIPDSWGKALQDRLDNQDLTPHDKNFMVRQVCREMERRDLTLAVHARHVAVLFVQKYPIFNGRFGTLHSSVETSIKTCLKNRHRTLRRLEARSRAQAEMMKVAESRINVDTKGDFIFNEIKETLDKTRVQRKLEANRLTASEFLAKYSALQRKDMLLWEFGRLVNIVHWKLLSNWQEALERMKKANWFPDIEYADENTLSVGVLMKLPARLKGKAGKCLLQIYPAETPMENVVPGMSRIPQLVAIGDPKLPELLITCYVDGVPVFSSYGAEAVILLIGVHRIFGISFCTTIKQQCTFLSAAVFGESSPDLIRHDLLNYKSVSDLLESLAILPLR